MARRETSAGCVIYRHSPRGIEVALIQPRGKLAWSLPKGLVERGESARSGAEREAREETGLTGVLGEKIDTIQYRYHATWQSPPQQIFKTVTFFLLECTGGDPNQHDHEVERVEWFALSDAINAMSYKLERNVLHKASKLIQSVEAPG